jgi:transposase
MKKNYQIFIGIDVSKDKLDYCIVTDATATKHQFGIVTNNEKGIKQLIALVQKINTNSSDTLYCLENTGIYSMPLCYWLQASGENYWVEDALQIKRSSGINRGKNDKADAKLIALYAIAHIHLYTPALLPENDFLELKLLLAEREKLVKAINSFKATNENKGFLPEGILKTVLAHNKKTTEGLQKQLNAIEKLIQQLIDSNATFKTQQKLLMSITGIGVQTAAYMIAVTNGFTSFKNWRKFACYCGVAPFKYSSGKSVKGKTKVSHIANKKLKSLLSIAAVSAKRYDPEIKEYYQRKLKEGKNKMCVLNAVRCKVISRVFAVINRKTPFVNIQKFKMTS